MMDVALMVIIVGILVIALGVDVAAVVAWLRRWRS